MHLMATLCDQCPAHVTMRCPLPVDLQEKGLAEADISELLVRLYRHGRRGELMLMNPQVKLHESIEQVDRTG
jgi:hypothetical protein